MNEKSFESRRVRTHPWTRIASLGAVLCSACLIGVAESCVILNRATPNVQRSTLLRKATTVAGAQLRSNARGELTRLDDLATRIPRESIAVSPLRIAVKTNQTRSGWNHACGRISLTSFSKRRSPCSESKSGSSLMVDKLMNSFWR